MTEDTPHPLWAAIRAWFTPGRPAFVTPAPLVLPGTTPAEWLATASGWLRFPPERRGRWGSWHLVLAGRPVGIRLPVGESRPLLFVNFAGPRRTTILVGADFEHSPVGPAAPSAHVGTVPTLRVRVETIASTRPEVRLGERVLEIDAPGLRQTIPAVRTALFEAPPASLAQPAIAAVLDAIERRHQDATQDSEESPTPTP